MNSNDGNIKLKSTKELPNHLSLIPLNVVPARPIDTSIQEIAENYLKTGKLNKCLDNFLSKDRPNLKRREILIYQNGAVILGSSYRDLFFLGWRVSMYARSTGTGKPMLAQELYLP